MSPDTYQVCVGEFVSFNSSITATQFDWDFGGAIVPNNPTTQVITNAQCNTPGTFTITLRVNTDCCGWTEKDTVTVIVGSTPTFAMSGNLQYCSGGSTTLNITSPADSIQWSPFVGLSTDTGSVVTLE